MILAQVGCAHATTLLQALKETHKIQHMGERISMGGGGGVSGTQRREKTRTFLRPIFSLFFMADGEKESKREIEQERKHGIWTIIIW